MTTRAGRGALAHKCGGWRLSDSALIRTIHSVINAFLQTVPNAGCSSLAIHEATGIGQVIIVPPCMAFMPAVQYPEIRADEATVHNRLVLSCPQIKWGN